MTTRVMRFGRAVAAWALPLTMLTGCRPAPPPPAAEPAMSIPTLTHEDFGRMPDGDAVGLYTFKNGHVEVRVTNLGATITAIRSCARASWRAAAAAAGARTRRKRYDEVRTVALMVAGTRQGAEVGGY